MSPRAVLVGLPGTGKTTIGRRLAKILVLRFTDSDELVEAATGRRITDIFAADGEAEFRRLEAAAIASALREFDGVLSLGGGAITVPGTRRLLAESGVAVIWLQADHARLLERIGRSTARPLMAGDADAALARLAAEREPLYREVSTMSVDGTDRTPGQLAAHLAARLHEREVAR